MGDCSCKTAAVWKLGFQKSLTFPQNCYKKAREGNWRCYHCSDNFATEILIFILQEDLTISISLMGSLYHHTLQVVFDNFHCIFSLIFINQSSLVLLNTNVYYWCRTRLLFLFRLVIFLHDFQHQALAPLKHISKCLARISQSLAGFIPSNSVWTVSKRLLLRTESRHSKSMILT